jgi:hypothetical protein
VDADLILNRLDKIEGMIDKMMNDFKNLPQLPACSKCKDTGYIKFEVPGMSPSAVRPCPACSLAKCR